MWKMYYYIDITALWTLVLGLICIAEAGLIGDRCDWSGSGLSSSTVVGVTPVYLRCREGRVSWVYPRGALRVLFHPPRPAGEREFRVCVRVMRRPDPPDLFHTLLINDTEKAERFPVRLFVESPSRLVPLYAPDDGDPRELRCFKSRGGQAALYVEAEPEEGPKKRVAILQYEAKPLLRKHYDPATAECRPCSESEMEMAFCTSDLVSRGIFIGTEQREDLDTTQLTVRLTKLLRATGAGAHDATDAAIGDVSNDNYYRYETDNALPISASGSAGGVHAHAHVHVARACGAAAGAGEFLVMARRRLGRYSLVCAPRLTHWQDFVDRRKDDGDAYCLLHH